MSVLQSDVDGCFPVATAIQAGCDAFLTNDIELKRVTEIRVLVV